MQMVLEIIKTERMTTAENKKIESSFHIHAKSSGKYAIEVVVRNSEEKARKRKCDTFGDEITGIKTTELKKLLQENPARKFLPS